MSIFVGGGVNPNLVGRVLEIFSKDPRIGGQNVFLGQVRADKHPEGVVTAIEFSTHREMADEAVRSFLLRIAGHEQLMTMEGLDLANPLPRVFIRHALGLVPVGSVPIIIAVGAERRAEAFRVCRELLEALKSEAPIFGKELLDTEAHKWKANT